ncbi:hypothetical protein F2Q68_00014030 [Brassica cretica]|uniref:Uncharacterized protein n=1 Tax=Brassica cretica TaxID=69181 RepID=A0A8S9HMJ4_BRACR|nr:hypothetical protein F2Q68_00014030 [Brassica cretica]
MAIVSPSGWSSSTSTWFSLVDDGQRRFLSLGALLDEGNDDCSLSVLSTKRRFLSLSVASSRKEDGELSIGGYLSLLVAL